MTWTSEPRDQIVLNEVTHRTRWRLGHVIRGTRPRLRQLSYGWGQPRVALVWAL